MRAARSRLIYHTVAALSLVNISLAYSNDFSFGTIPGGGSEPAEAAIVTDYIQLQNVEQRLQAFDNDVFGDKIDLNTGTTSFSVTDVNLPGNFSLPVAITRMRSAVYDISHTDAAFLGSLSLSNMPKGAYTGLMGDWQVDVPQITWTWAGRVNSHGQVLPPSDEIKNFCGPNGTFTTIIPMYAYARSNIRIRDAEPGFPTSFIEHADFSDGMNVRIPGQASHKLLNAPKGVNWPSGTKYVTKDYHVVKCAGTINNGAKGLKVYSPNGDVYEFNQFVVRPAKGLPINYWYNNSYVVNTVAPKFKSTLLATRVTDRHGNTVNYTYRSDGRLSRISASDGRIIDVVYNNTGRIAQIIANGRKWTYEYQTISNAYVYLSKVTRPDGTFWAYDFTKILEAKSEFDCASPDVTWTATHPSGLRGTFLFKERAHPKGNEARPGETASCINSAKPQYRNTYDLMALDTKTLSGPGMEDETWRYTYKLFNNNTSRRTTWTDVVDPRGARTRVTYHHSDNKQLQGMIKRQQFYHSNGALARTINNTYIVEGELGTTYLNTSQNPAHNRPRLSRTTSIIEAGDTFSTTNTYNSAQSSAAYSFGRPMAVSESNTANQHTRTSAYTYQNVLSSSRWLLSLPVSTDVNGKRIETHYYDSNYRRTRLDKYGELDATFGYYNTAGYRGALAWVQDSASRRFSLYDYRAGTSQRIVRQADNAVILQQVDSFGNLTKKSDWEGNCTEYQYDKVNRLTLIDPCDNRWADTSITYPLTISSEGFSNVEARMLKQIIQHGQHQTSIYYDAKYRPLMVKDSDLSGVEPPRYTKSIFDFDNQVRFQSFPSHASNPVYGTSTTYDGLGRPVTVTDNTRSGNIAYAYLADNKIRVTDNKGHQTTTTYLAYGAPETKTPLIIASPEGVNTNISVDSLGKVKSITQGGITEYRVYDNRQRLCKTIRPDVGNTAFGYNNVNALIWKANGSSISNSTTSCDNTVDTLDKVTYQYHSTGYLHRVLFNDTSPDQTRIVNKNGQVLELVAGSVSQTYGYNSLGLVEWEQLNVDTQSPIIDYHYNALGQVDGITYPGTSLMPYMSNAFGEAQRVGSLVTNARYHANGMLKSANYLNGFSYTSVQTNSGLPASYEHRKSALVALSHAFSYDANNNVTMIDDRVLNAYDLRMTYDGLDRLFNINDSYSGTGHIRYDTSGNITAYKLGSRTINYAYNTNNQLSHTYGGHSKTFSYDDKGNVINNARYSFTYNAANQMVSAGNHQYLYDAGNRRVKKTVNGDVTYSMYGISGKLMWQRKNNQESNYYYLNNQLIARKDGSTTTYVHSDYLGSPAAETTTAGNLKTRMHYQPFGESIEISADDVGYTGHLFDKELGLNYMQARYYDPVIGRFYSNDPVGFRDVHSFNRYAYVNNNPYKYIDPTGEIPYLVSRPLTKQEAVDSHPGALWPNHNFIAVDGDYPGDPNATIISFGKTETGNMGRVFGEVQAADRAHWLSLSSDETGASFRVIDATDSEVSWVADTVEEYLPYAAVPSFTGNSANSNSGAGAVATAADGGSTSVPGAWQPGHKQSSRVTLGRSIQVVRVTGRVDSKKLDDQ